MLIHFLNACNSQVEARSPEQSLSPMGALGTQLLEPMLPPRALPGRKLEPDVDREPASWCRGQGKRSSAMPASSRNVAHAWKSSPNA